MISGKSETEPAEVPTTTGGGGEEAGRRVRRHSSGTVKRHDGISEIALDIFACTVYVRCMCVCVCAQSAAELQLSTSSSSLPLLVRFLIQLFLPCFRETAACYRPIGKSLIS